MEPTQSNKVLIVDDDTEFTKRFSDCIKAAGLEPVTALTGKEALDYLTENTVAFIVLDFVMPEMDGYTFHHILTHDMRKNIPTIILTNMPGTKDNDNLEVYIKSETNFEDLAAKIKARLSEGHAN